MEFRSVIVGRREKLAAPWPAVWSSSDSTKVRVHEYERGWLSAVDIGTADITASEVGGSGKMVYRVSVVPWSAHIIVDGFRSVSVGRREKLTAPWPAVWSSSDSTKVRVHENERGWLSAVSIGTADITASEVGGSGKMIFRVSVVPWSANRIALEPVEVFDDTYSSWALIDGYIYYSRSTAPPHPARLYRTNDDFATSEEICVLPGAPLLLLNTPRGYFLRTSSAVYESSDLTSWTAKLTCGAICLQHGFDSYHDPASGNVYVYTGEYRSRSSVRFSPSDSEGFRCRVYRGTIEPSGDETWETVLQFYSRDELTADPRLSPATRHVHVVTVDPYTGDVWVGTGDYDPECHIFRSADNGATWSIVGEGSQEWRTLSIWFTEGYVYWNMDTWDNQKIFRIPRAWLGVKTPAEMDADKETVARLRDGSLWFHIWAKDTVGDDVVIMGASNEGEKLDKQARTYLIKELADGSTQVEEVLVVGDPSNPDSPASFMQLGPMLQSPSGSIYVNGRSTVPATTWRCVLRNRGTP